MAALAEITSSFKVDNVWYEMSYPLCVRIQREIGRSASNREIVAHIHANLPRYSIVEHWNGVALFCYVTER